MFSSFIYMFVKVYKKKLLLLLFIELGFLSLICLNFFHAFGSGGVSASLSPLIFLTFMVLDSVLGLCLLICCSRNSSYFSDFFFGL